MITRKFLVLFITLLFALPIAAQSRRPELKKADAQRNLVARKPPALSLEIGEVTPIVAKVKRASAGTVCAGDQVSVRIRSEDPNVKPTRYAWVATGGRVIGEGEEIIFDTTNLPPGAYHITAQALYTGLGVCNGDCTAYDTKTIRVTECPPEIICFTSPVLSVSPESRTVKPCEKVTFRVSEVTGGQNYGAVNYTWSSSAGRITSGGTTATLDTCDLAPGTEIEVTVRALSEYANCEATGVARVLIPIPPPPAREMTPCYTFKRNNARVDNACKSVLNDAVRALQYDPLSRLIIDAYSNPGEASSVAFARGKNVRDRLADGSVGVTIDANRIIVRVAGEAPENQVRLWFLPEGAEIPAGGQTVDVGPVESEKKSADDGHPASRTSRRPRN